ncbi:MAG: hypothetical protein MRERC_3c097 [Mycoplasmataceae bacterium RC_NB112A]|nr:MAG: hypothetical protein MRERC_12c040 [Mycoplasmataceae bacterium RC_NB112A]KLL02251.1 MAG: hypothetical protein MRERC_3c097 [Mycoplasmataceae bacterium RC_NB112A]
MRYLESREERIFLANKLPFDYYQAGGFLGINIEMVHRNFFADSYTWEDKSVVSKVISRPPQFYLKHNFTSDEFGDGWAEEVE